MDQTPGAGARNLAKGMWHAHLGWLFDAYEKFLRRPVPKVRILGGGAQSELWCQIYADVFGRPVKQVADPRNAQLRGVALWARICLGELTLDDVVLITHLVPGTQRGYHVTVRSSNLRLRHTVMAVENNLGIQIARYDPQIEDLSVAQARGAWTPSLSHGICGNVSPIPKAGRASHHSVRGGKEM